MHGGGNFSPAVFSFFGKEDKMKGFVRANQNVGLCGLSCGLCSMKMGGYCPGCGGGGGNQSCAMAKCSMERGGISHIVWSVLTIPVKNIRILTSGILLLPIRIEKKRCVACWNWEKKPTQQK